MKKMFAVFFGIFILCAARPIDSYATCKDSTMTAEEIQLTDCSNLGIANGGLCWSYCPADDKVVLQGVQKCQDLYYPWDMVTGTQNIPNFGGPLYKKCISEHEACDKSRLLNVPTRWDSEKGHCVCTGNSLLWNGYTGKCEQSDEFAACNADAGNGADWDYQGGYCWCRGVEGKTFWNSKTGYCEFPPDQQKCARYSLFAKWNGTNCACTKDEDGIGIPTDRWRDYHIVDNCAGGKPCCKLRPSAAARQQAEINAPAAREKAQQINGIAAELDKYQARFGKSHWKNASGGFNTARLASDSVAGVVLGTIGGVITSNIIKKNQVNDGFEDINCVINGQVVAGFHDKFNVGIR